ncbi:MAG: DUF4446 family protein [Armatimonadota bacterium]|nr:DUF4446 family protein [Armatimonadota bacterium]
METLPNAYGVALLVLALVNLWLLLWVRSVSRNYARLTQGSQGENLEGILNEHLDRVVAAVERTERLEAVCKDLRDRLQGCIQRVGIVRFDAFEDVGGQFSFALALLDEQANGVVITALHGRRDTRVYVKALRAGRSEVTLSTEEVEAVRQAGAEPVAPRLARTARLENGV